MTVEKNYGMAESLTVFGAVKGLFEYNRENFIFDRTLNQSRVYQTQKMRVAQIKLYRDDLRDLFALTIRKMDTYLMFNALLLLFTGGLFYEGRLPQGTPAWLLWLWTMSLGSAFLFLSMSIWFAIHASITAQTFQVRLLTQWLRLPIPSADDIHAVSGGATEFEEARAGTMLRVPGVNNARDAFNCVEKFPDVPNELLKTDLVEDYTLFVEHFYLFRELQKHWQGFDAYARIGMVLGTNMLLSGFSYMSLAYFLMSFKNWGGLVLPFILSAFQLIHMKINLRGLSRFEHISLWILVLLPVVLASLAGVQAVLQQTTFYADILSPVIFACSGCWIIFLTLIGSEDDGGLPCRFVTVGSIDVLGLDEDDARFQALSPASGSRKRERSDSRDSSGNSPMSEREGADTPVAIAVPPAPIITQAEARRRQKTKGEESEPSATIMSDALPKLDEDRPLSSRISEVKYYPSLGAVEEVVENEIPLSTILESSLGLNGGARRSDEDSLSVQEEEGIGPVEQTAEEEIGAYKCSVKVKSLPWRSYRETGAVLVCLWIFATAYSILASFQPRWGWPRTYPHGDGEDETPLSAPFSAAPRRLSFGNMDMFTVEQSFGRVEVKDLEGDLRLSVDVVDLNHVFLNEQGNLVLIERLGDPRIYSLIDNS